MIEKSVQDILKKVRQIEIKAKGLSNHIFAGEYHTSFKGRGMSFSEVREYQYGDDIRTIDWNVTARCQNPHIKVFEEERELNLFLLIDISNSGIFGSKYSSKKDIITEVAALLSFSALKNNDKIGVIFFSDKIEHLIIPKKGKSHVLRIIRDILTHKPSGHGTNISKALEYLNQIQKKKSIAFLLSDFLDESYEKPLALVCKKHDLVGVQIWDKYDEELPKLGLIDMKDSESGQTYSIDTMDKTTQKNYSENFKKYNEYASTNFKKLGLDIINIRTDEDYIKIFQTFFKNRMRK